MIIIILSVYNIVPVQLVMYPFNAITPQSSLVRSGQIEKLVLHSKTWTQLIVCKQ